MRITLTINIPATNTDSHSQYKNYSSIVRSCRKKLNINLKGYYL